MSETNPADLSRGFRLEHVCVEPHRERLLIDDEAIHLEPKVMQVLVELAKQAQQPVAREALLQSVWHDAVVGEEVLSRAVSLLRTSLGDERTDPKFIRTIPRFGYELIVPIRPLTALTSSQAPTRLNPRWWVMVGLVVVLTMLAWFWNGTRNEAKVVVMMPINASAETLGGAAKGLSDDLHRLLSSGKQLQVISRSWSFAVRDPAVVPQRIGEQFGADYVMQGDLEGSATQMSLTLELVEASSGRSQWQQHFVADSVLALQQLVVPATQQALNRLLDAELQAITRTKAAVSQTAYQLFLQARHHWSLRGAGHIERAASLLGETIAQAPDFAPARLALAQVIAIQPFYADINESEVSRHSTQTNLVTADDVVQSHFKKAQEHLEGLLATDAEFTPQAQALQGFMSLRTREFEAAGQALHASLKAKPDYALGQYWASMYYAAINQAQRSVYHAEQAVRLEPATPVFRDRLAVSYLWVNDEPAAHTEFMRAEELGFALDFRSKAYILFLHRTQRYPQLRTLLNAMQLPPEWVLAFVDGLTDSNQLAAAIDATHTAIASDRLPKELRFGAWVFLGQAELALAAFDMNFTSPDVELLWAKECDFLRSTPAYNRLLTELKLSDERIMSYKTDI